MAGWEKQYPPYMGEEPYLFFAFSQSDRGKAWNILRLLLRRGVRVWYCAGAAGSSEELLLRQRRAVGAQLTLLLLTDAAVADRDGKSLILVNQKAGRPIVCLDSDGTDRRLAMGLREDTPHLPLYRYTGKTELEEALIRAPGFRQELLGASVQVRGFSPGRLALALTLAAVLLIGASAAGLYLFHWFQPKIVDTVAFSDAVVMEAVRREVGGGALTEESVGGVTVLRLKALPESWADLARLPALERIILPQEALTSGASLPEGEYTFELSGGEGP